jgi:hypothetical protein
MGKLKVTLVRKASQLTKLKATGYSIILGRNLIKNTDADKDNKKVRTENNGGEKDGKSVK